MVLITTKDTWLPLFTQLSVYYQKFERAFAEYHDARYGIGVSNGTVALELILVTSGIEPGDEVLVPAVTFIASASAVVTSVGAVPVFVDIDPETACISPDGVEAVVHYGGYPPDFDRLLPICQKHDLVLMEDCAHAQGTEWKGRTRGSRSAPRSGSAGSLLRGLLAATTVGLSPTSRRQLRGTPPSC